MSSIEDPVADLMTRIRNGQQAGHATVEIPASSFKESILEILVEYGYLAGSQRTDEGPQGTLVAELKYDREGDGIIQSMQRVSKPARRVYAGVDEIPEVLNGLGIAVVSTSQGVMSGDDARAANMGGEVLCKIY